VLAVIVPRQRGRVLIIQCVTQAHKTLANAVARYDVHADRSDGMDTVKVALTDLPAQLKQEIALPVVREVCAGRMDVNVGRSRMER
jgi:hypothetical protein